MPDIFWQALCAGVGLTFLSGPLGVLTIWRRLAFLGDSLAHASILGVALGMLWQLNVSASIFVTVMAVALLLVWLLADRRVPSDTLLAVISSGALALGLLLVGMNTLSTQSYTTLLMGDILNVTRFEVISIWVAALVIGSVIKIFWERLIFISLDEALASVEGIAVRRLNALFCVLLALCIALGTKLVGVVLMSALLLIPAASSRILSNTPERMLFMSTVLGSFSILSGLLLSFYFDMPTGPAIVVVSVGLFFMMQILGRFRGC